MCRSTPTADSAAEFLANLHDAHESSLSREIGLYATLYMLRRQSRYGNWDWPNDHEKEFQRLRIVLFSRHGKLRPTVNGLFLTENSYRKARFLS